MEAGECAATEKGELDMDKATGNGSGARAVRVGTAMMLALLLALAACMLCACGGSDSGSTGADQKASPSAPATGTQAISVMEETTEQGLIEKTNVSLPAPEGATDVQYFAYMLENPIAEMRFTLDGVAMNERAQITDLIAFPVKGEDVVAACEKGDPIENPADISGYYYMWDSYEPAQVQNREAQCYTSKDGEGLIIWLDVVPGVLYTLTMDKNATPEALVAAADRTFYPLQGEVG